jgi:site-specific recombinase XerD
LFAKFLGFTPAELIAKIESGEIHVEDELNSWMDYLTANHLASQTLRVYFAALKKFVEVNLPRHQFYWKTVELPRLRGVEPDRCPQKSELLRILQHADLRDKLIVCIASSSGVREGALAGLKVKNVDLDLYPDVGVVRVPAELNKSRIAYVSFITPQTRSLLEEYLETRRAAGPVMGTDPLISHYQGHKTISKGGISNRWRNLLKETRLDEKGRKFHVLRMHTLRKYFATQLTVAGVLPSPRERMMGHMSGFRDPNLAQDLSYYRPEIEDLLKEYRKAIPHLTIAEETTDDWARRRQMVLDIAKIAGLDNGAVKEIEKIIDKSGTFDEGLEELRRELPKLQEAMRRLIEAGIVKKPEGWDETQRSGES